MHVFYQFFSQDTCEQERINFIGQTEKITWQMLLIAMSVAHEIPCGSPYSRKPVFMESKKSIKNSWKLRIKMEVDIRFKAQRKRN